VDGRIAAVARANDLALVTSNTAELGGFRGLRVEGWI
jgi:predicted nucleic acid-binding protein